MSRNILRMQFKSQEISFKVTKAWKLIFKVKGRTWDHHKYVKTCHRLIEKTKLIKNVINLSERIKFYFTTLLRNQWRILRCVINSSLGISQPILNCMLCKPTPLWWHYSSRTPAQSVTWTLTKIFQNINNRFVQFFFRLSTWRDDGAQFDGSLNVLKKNYDLWLPCECNARCAMNLQCRNFMKTRSG